MFSASILYALLLLECAMGLPKSQRYVFRCGFQRCDKRVQWSDAVTGECLSCWSLGGTVINLIIGIFLQNYVKGIVQCTLNR